MNQAIVHAILHNYHHVMYFLSRTRMVATNLNFICDTARVEIQTEVQVSEKVITKSYNTTKSYLTVCNR